MTRRGFSLIEVVLASGLLILVLSNAALFAARHGVWQRQFDSSHQSFNQRLAAMQQGRADLSVFPSGVTQTTVQTHLIQLNDGNLKTWVYQK